MFKLIDLYQSNDNDIQDIKVLKEGEFSIINDKQYDECKEFFVLKWFIDAEMNLCVSLKEE